MDRAAYKFIFANAILAVCARGRALGYGDTKTRDLCRCIALAFSLSEPDGDSAYTSVTRPDNGLETIKGFEIDSIYEDYEQDVIDVLTSNTYGITPDVIETLSVGVHAVIFGYALNPNISINYLYLPIGLLLRCLSSTYFTTPYIPYTLINDNETVVHAFSAEVINTLLQQNNYRLVMGQVSESPKNFEVNMVNYNWYDTTDFFTNPNLDLMKDSENQYYYVSGRLIYDDSTHGLPYCMEETVAFDTRTGIVQSVYLKNGGCKQELAVLCIGGVIFCSEIYC